MQKKTVMGYCVTCNKTFPVEVRVAGKIVGAGATALFGSATRLPWWGTALLGLASVALGHAMDEALTKICPTPGCRTALKLLAATVV